MTIGAIKEILRYEKTNDPAPIDIPIGMRRGKTITKGVEHQDNGERFGLDPETGHRYGGRGPGTGYGRTDGTFGQTLGAPRDPKVRLGHPDPSKEGGQHQRDLRVQGAKGRGTDLQGYHKPDDRAQHGDRDNQYPGEEQDARMGKAFPMAWNCSGHGGIWTCNILHNHP